MICRALPLTAFGIIVGLGHVGSAGAQSQTATSATVQVEPLKRQDLVDSATGLGAVGVSDEATVDVSFPYGGQIEDLRVRAGQRVQKGQKLVSITADPATLLAFKKASAAADFAQNDLARIKTLLSQHLATNAQVAAAQKSLADAVAELAAQRKLGNDQPVRTVEAPFDAVVVKLMAAPGDRLQPNATILQLTRSDRGARVTAGLRPQDALKVLPGMTAQISPMLASAAKPLEGFVRQVNGLLNPSTRLIDVWIDVAQASDLVSGMPVSVKIIVAQHAGWAVPRDAVLSDSQGSYIFQIDAGVARRVNVKTGLQTDATTEIIGSFDPALEVVTAGNYELRDKMRVRVQPSSKK